MSLLAGRRIVVTGVLTEASLASAVVRLALAEGAEVLLTSPVCRAHRITSRVAPRLGVAEPVLELDVTLEQDLAALAEAVREAGWDRVDGVVHALGYLPEGWDATTFAATPWRIASEALEVTAWSLAAVIEALDPLLVKGSAVVGITSDTSRTWGSADWLQVAHAALAATARGLARELGPRGVRVNLVASGPVRTLLARALPSHDELAAEVDRRAPLGWDSSSAEATAKAVVMLLSPWFPATTGQVVPVDGGATVVGVA
jgi:enoyl ACP reductase